jgi:hypothetical protein
MAFIHTTKVYTGTFVKFRFLIRNQTQTPGSGSQTGLKNVPVSTFLVCVKAIITLGLPVA